MNKRLTKRFIIKSLDDLNLSSPIRYERYYINDNLRIQKKNEKYEKEILNENNALIKKETINKEEFDSLKGKAYKEIIRDSYLYIEDDKISIKKYYGTYEGLLRVEITFKTENEMVNYQKESWMGTEITNTSLAFDKDLSKLDRMQFLEVLSSVL